MPGTGNGAKNHLLGKWISPEKGEVLLPQKIRVVYTEDALPGEQSGGRGGQGTGSVTCGRSAKASPSMPHAATVALLPPPSVPSCHPLLLDHVTEGMGNDTGPKLLPISPHLGTPPSSSDSHKTAKSTRRSP
ncbi:hypothetical protein H920_14506 [Fukomys damarensis]|uniref:Uncharacterized protein n=1 Tax=Fukomys damarensis TaxID=885580 RepID=A0A091CWK9_FUKDA|nr:hypothetical protein H920_14506 [Fukomys damarensis]